ncbi:hypothetical protein Mnod_7931 (plasmid) [Methylobacterium nodulans ORS 2060]|uniref:Uncharacterized protein n=1 Tax=Methylobacterium nodulans (strain LMG 21967 / CNCM I-2342 / ORS 2060) TaxID=460265 RepID=B8IWP7_METNO|nr:hypothetical protein Mnod_7931 [Methylobacterium nodulans ORS 2060]
MNASYPHFRDADADRLRIYRRFYSHFAQIACSRQKVLARCAAGSPSSVLQPR